jgi:hypothetical protein
MRLKLLLITLLAVFNFAGMCQPVNYVTTLDSVKNYIERNYAGFADKVTPATQPVYEEHTRQAYAYAKQAKTWSGGYFALNYWLNFFKDEHIYIRPSPGAGVAATKQPASKPVQPLFEEEKRVNAFYKKLNDSTGYIRIKSFDVSYATRIDSVIKTNLPSIQSMPRLVIDLRGNGGGADRSASFLRPIVYTNPVKNIGADLLITPDNIAAWDYAIFYQYRNQIPKSQLDHLLQVLARGRGKERDTVNFSPDYTGTLPAVWPMPAKVAIVIDRGCGSATEEFLLFARQSKKVVMACEHSKGVLDYSNVVQHKFFYPDFELHYPTTRSRRIDVGLGIDNTGVQPDLPLNLGANNWLNELLIKW